MARQNDGLVFEVCFGDDGSGPIRALLHMAGAGVFPDKCLIARAGADWCLTASFADGEISPARQRVFSKISAMPSTFSSALCSGDHRNFEGFSE